MKNLSLTIAALALTACGDKGQETPAVPAPPNTNLTAPAAPSLNVAKIMRAYDKDLAKYFGLQLGMSLDEAESIIKPQFAKEEGGEGNQSFSYAKTQSDTGGIVIIATAEGVMDDSVAAQELIAVFSKDGSGQLQLSEYGARIKCWRGDKKDEWITEFCP